VVKSNTTFAAFFCLLSDTMVPSWWHVVVLFMKR